MVCSRPKDSIITEYIQWLKAIILVSWLLFTKLVLASGTTGIEDLNKQAAEQMREFIAKGGGVAYGYIFRISASR